MGKLEGKVAVVTGGARDIGRAISVKLALEGAKVCLNYFDNPDDAAATVAMIKADGGEAIAVQGDMQALDDLLVDLRADPAADRRFLFIVRALRRSADRQERAAQREDGHSVFHD